MEHMIFGAIVGTGINAAIGVPPRTCLLALGAMALLAEILHLAGMI
jgi:hypothetical protein